MDLTPPEAALIKKLSAGESTSFSDELPLDIRTIRAPILRHVLIGLDKEGVGPRGVEIVGARVTGELDLTDMTLPFGLHLINCEMTGPVALYHARLPRLALVGSTLVQLNADGVQIEKGLNAQDLECRGTVRLLGARIDGQLNLAGARLVPGSGPALQADGLRVSGDLLLRSSPKRNFVAQGGGVRLPAADIGGDLDCQNAGFTGADGPSLNAERARIGGNIVLKSARIRGGVYLHSGSARGQLNCVDAEVGWLTADGFHTDGDVILTGLRGHGAGAEPTVGLMGAHVGGNLVCDKGTVSGRGLTFDARFATVGKALSLGKDFIDGEHDEKVALDGLTYRSVPHEMTRAEWLVFLRDRSHQYAAQPYQQLASVYRSAGLEDDSRAILIAQQDDRLRNGLLSGSTRLRLRLLKLTLGYGYQSWRAAICLALVLACAVVFVVTAARTTGAVTPPESPAHSPAACSLVDKVGLGFDLAVPIVNTTSRQRCTLKATKPAEEWIVAVGWLFQISGWAFTTLFVAGYTGLIRKS